MSVVLDRPVTKTRLPEIEAPVFLKPRIRVEPEYRPGIEAPAQTPAEMPVKVQRRSKVNVGRQILLKGMMFVAVFGVSYVASTLSGHYLVEKSRNQTIEATARATAALQSEREVRRRLDALTSASSIEDWALSHSFRPTDGLGQTSKVVSLVAINH